MEPSSGFYWDPVLVLDFKGMYPSLIVAHNLSFDTCLGHSRRTGLGPSSQMGVLSGPWQLGASANELAESFDGTEGELQDPAVRLAASGALFVGPQVRKGLLPLMLAEVLQLRAETKKLAKQSCASLAKRLEHKQFALKYFANVTYGYSSASFSGRMPCSELADSIVATGRRALEEAANFIEANWEGAKIVYGDTDSVFVQLKGYSLEEAFQTGRQICAEVSAKHPAPVELEFEKVYMPCLCLTKKRYGGLAYAWAKPPSEGGTGNFEAKGLEAIRRDQCRMASNVQNEILTDFFRTKDLSSVKRIFVAHATDILKGSPGSRHSVADLSFFREARLGTYRAEAEDGGGATLPPQAAVAVSRIAAEGDTAAPEYGERVSFAVAVGDVGSRLVDRCPWEVRPQMLPLRTQHFVQASAPSVAVNQMYPRLVSGYAPAVPLQRPLAAPAPRMLRSGPQLPRMLRVGPVAVQVMEEPSMQSKRLPWVVQEPGQVVLTSGATHGEWVQLLFAHLRKGWAPLRSFLPEPRGGMHGDGMYDGLDRAICSHQSEMLEVILGELKPRQLSRADGQSFHLQKDGWQAYAWLPACQGPVPLIVVLHGSRPMDWDFLSQFAERWQKDAMEYQVAVIVPESIGPTWDYLLTCQRKDMDFIEYAINEVDVDDRSIAVMGMSDGASLALSMALRNPRVFTTALVQATGFFHDPLPMRLKPRVYMEYGQEDKLFEPDRVAYPNRDRLREDGCEVEFMMIPGAGHMVQEEFFHRALDFWLRGARPSTRRELCTAGSPTDCRLDRWWYVEKALLPCTARILHSDLAGLPPNLDVNSWLREVRRPSSSRARGPLDRLLRPSCRKCGEKAIFGDMCGACTGPAAKEQLQQKAQESRHAVEELQKTCVSCAGCLWKSCNAAEFCDVRTRRGEAENDMARLTALMEELQLEGPGKRSSSGPAVDDWKSPEALVFDVNSDSEDEPSGIKQEAKAATSGAVKQEKEEGEDDALCISSEEEQINATQLDEEEGEEGHATAAAPMETSEPSREPPPLCKHQEVCREVEVKKEGANKGRHFFVCPRGREEQCDFFAWADGTAGASRTFDKRHILGDSKRGRFGV
eukprot:symbB.v1.2.025103.t1/scaffold2405.1/size80018/3